MMTDPKEIYSKLEEIKEAKKEMRKNIKDKLVSQFETINLNIDRIVDSCK